MRNELSEYALFEKECSEIYEQEDKMDITLAAYKREKIHKFHEWAWKLPFMKFPAHWEVRAIPPFGNLMVRYHIRGPNLKGKEHISIYLDCWNKAGAMPWPYWEFYGGFAEDCCRCKWDDIDGPEGFMAIMRKRLGEDEKNFIKASEDSVIFNHIMAHHRKNDWPVMFGYKGIIYKIQPTPQGQLEDNLGFPFRLHALHQEDAPRYFKTIEAILSYLDNLKTVEPLPRGVT